MKYSKFNDLNKFVLKPSVKEINAKSDLNVMYSVNRQGKTPKSITFIIKSTKPKELNHPMLSELMNLELSKDISNEILKLYDTNIQELKEKIHIINQRKDKIKNLSAYSYKVLTKDKSNNKNVNGMLLCKPGMKLKDFNGNEYIVTDEYVIRDNENRIIFAEGLINKKIKDGDLVIM
jgi:plasmid replication initiation protein